MSSLGEEFQAHVGRLAVKDGRVMPFDVTVLGLTGEYGELFRAARPKNGEVSREEVIKEFGDFLFYSQHLLTLLLAEPAKEARWEYDYLEPVEALFLLAEVAKKWEWHGKRATSAEVVYYLESVCLGALDLVLPWEDPLLDILEEAMMVNITKLRARYPEGFVEGGGVR